MKKKIDVVIIDEFDSRVFLHNIANLVTHLEQKNGLTLLQVRFTGWLCNGKFEVQRHDGKKKFISLQEVLK